MATSTPAGKSVTELALLTLSSDASTLTSTLKGALSRARAAMERVSGQPFAYIHCAAGAQNQVFIVGGWPSVKFHMEEWIPSAENQALVKEFGELGVGVKWMWHLGVEREVVDRVVLGGEERGVKVKIWRAAVAKERVREVQRVLGMGDDIDASGQRGAAVGGVRLDDGFMAEGEREKSLRNEEKGCEEVVLLTRMNVPGAVEEVDKVLGQAQSLVERWEVSEGVVLDV